MDDYTGLAATAWALFCGEEPGADYPFFRRALEQNPGPALDVGCGSGRLLLPLLSAGLDVEGLDPSSDILAICRARAARLGLTPVLHEGTIETFDFPRAYRTVFIPCGTIQLVIDRREARQALRRIYAHLEPGGVLIVTAFPWKGPEGDHMGEWRHRATAALPDGTTVTKHGRVEFRDTAEQLMAGSVRYQRFDQGRLIEEQICSAPERWYGADEMRLMLEQAGFRDIRVTGDYSEDDLTGDAYVMAFIGRKDSGFDGFPRRGNPSRG